MSCFFFSAQRKRIKNTNRAQAPTCSYGAWTHIYLYHGPCDPSVHTLRWRGRMWVLPPSSAAASQSMNSCPAPARQLLIIRGLAVRLVTHAVPSCTRRGTPPASHTKVNPPCGAVCAGCSARGLVLRPAQREGEVHYLMNLPLKC